MAFKASKIETKVSLDLLEDQESAAKILAEDW